MTSETQLDGAGLPGQASSAEEAKEGQHNEDNDDDPKPGHVILSVRSLPIYSPAGSSLFYSPAARLCNAGGRES
jgi:hypothetical protein